MPIIEYKKYRVGNVITREMAVDLIKSGKFLRVIWEKNNGKIASRNIRFGVVKTLKSGKTTVNTSEYLPVTDMGKYNSGNPSKSWINIKLSTIIGVVCDGTLMLVR